MTEKLQIKFSPEERAEVCNTGDLRPGLQVHICCHSSRVEPGQCFPFIFLFNVLFLKYDIWIIRVAMLGEVEIRQQDFICLNINI